MFLQTLARILADKLDVEVIYNPNLNTFAISKSPSGKLSIHLSTRILDTAGENVDALLRGALAHEALGHGYFTDMDELAKNGRYALCLANAFEDVRIEALAPTRFPGARRLLANMVAVLQQDFAFWQPSPVEDWQGNLVKGLLLKYRHKILGQPVNMDNCATMIETSVLPALGEDLFKRIDHLAEVACRASSTKEVNDAADAIVDLLANEAPEPQEDPQPPDNGDADPDNTGDEGDGEADGTAGNDNAGDPTQGDPSSGQPPAGAANDQDGSPAQDDQTDVRDRDNSRQRRPYNPDAEIKVDIEAALEQVSEDTSALKSTGLTIRSFADNTKQTSASPSVESNGSLARMIASQLENAVRSFTDDADDEESEIGRLNTESFVEIATGTVCRPFIEDGAPGHGIDTELMLLFDASGSMDEIGERKLQQLLKASLTALSQFAPDLGTSVAFFTDGASLEAKPGSKLTPKQINNIAHNYCPDGITCWAESVASLVPILAGSHRRRKVLFTVTDGKLPPLGDTPLMRELQRHGIECRFLSIGDQLPVGYEGMRCEPNPASFASAFCKTILAGILPQFA